MLDNILNDPDPDCSPPLVRSREAEAQRNRELYPAAAEFIDMVRTVFPGAKVTYLGPVRSHRPSRTPESI